eukprot:TRINITY_DN5348_c0_g1_i11.p1 TRINITY_DN5348_c0_g1~~TRINITY_DN5348_c0_g1_i11.p1  ORF type:complete len:208 (+),score=77.77 TRINITY_DN5348_c0_g1_i11:576-1199(+)
MESEEEDEENEIEALEKRAEERKLRQYRRAKVNAYYEGTFYGKSAAQMVYYIAQQLNKECSGMLWLAIVGVTSQYLNSQIAKMHYDEAVIEFQREILRFNQQKEGPKMAFEAVDETEEEKKQKLCSVNVQVGTILSQQELQFMLLRHWNLYESAYYSNFIAARLLMWKESGRHELNRFFALLGISLEDAKQQYKHMKVFCDESLACA